MCGKIPKLLIVDEAATVADTTAIVLRQEGYEVRTAYSAAEALNVIEAWNPTAAIIDVLLPEINGVGLAEMIQKKCPTCRILLFSTQTLELNPRTAGEHSV